MNGFFWASGGRIVPFVFPTLVRLHCREIRRGNTFSLLLRKAFTDARCREIASGTDFFSKDILSDSNTVLEIHLLLLYNNIIL